MDCSKLVSCELHLHLDANKCTEVLREGQEKKITDKKSALSRNMWTGSSSSWNHKKGKADLQFTLQICVKDMQQKKTECWRVNLALKIMCPSPLCMQWMKFSSTQTRDPCTRVIFSCKLQLMSGHICRGLCQRANHLPSLQPTSTDQGISHVHSEYLTSVEKAGFYSFLHTVIHMWAAHSPGPGNAVCRQHRHRHPELCVQTTGAGGGGCPWPRSPLPEPTFGCNPCDASIPSSNRVLCTDTTLPTGTPAPGWTGACPRLCPR